MDETSVRDALVTEVKAPVQIHWGPIFAGWVLAAGVAWLFAQLGAAIGLSVVNPAGGGASAQSFSFGAGFWVLLTWFVSLFVGGLFAGRLAGRSDRSIGMMHGAAVWGLTTVISVTVGALGLVNAFQGGASLIGGGVSAAASAARSVGGSVGGGSGAGGSENPALLSVQAQLKQAISDSLSRTGKVPPADVTRAMNQINGQTLASVAGQLLQGNSDAAKNILTVNTNLNRNEIDSIIGGMQSRIPQLKQEAAQTASTATHYSAAALWVAFVATLVAFGLAIWGGAIGAGSVPRLYDRRI